MTACGGGKEGSQAEAEKQDAKEAWMPLNSSQCTRRWALLSHTDTQLKVDGKTIIGVIRSELSAGSADLFRVRMGTSLRSRR